MQRLINLETVIHTPEGEEFATQGYSNWLEENKVENVALRWRIDQDSDFKILKDSIEDLYDDMQYKLNDMEVGDVIIKKGTKFNFFPGTNFPRQQFKELQQAHGVKSTRDAIKADYIVLNNSLMTGLEKTTWHYGKIDSDTMFNLLYFFDEHFLPGYEIVKQFDLDKTAIENHINERAEFVLGYSISTGIKHSLNYLKENDPNNVLTEKDHALLDCTLFNIGKGSCYTTTLTEQDYKLLTKFVDDAYDDKLVTTDLLSKVIDKHLDKVELDQEQYESLDTMFKSSDRDNHIVAMEIMANCHFKKSLLFIEKLFMDHSWTMWDTGKANHVNFRNLRKLVNRDDSYSMKTNRDFDHTMRVLDKFGMFNPESINFILESHLEHLKSLINVHSEFFNIKELTLNEKYLNKINFNYIYKLKDDFVPKTEEEIEEEIEKEELTLD